jgi:hypothetical protein
MEILGAIIAGLFTLAGVWLQNHLTNKNNEKRHIQSQKQAYMDIATEAPRQETIYKIKSRRGKGFLIFVGSFVLLVVVAGVFHTTGEELATWLFIFGLFSMFIVPIYSIYLMIRG